MQRLLYAIGGFILVLIAIGFALPRHVSVSATIEIDAYPATVFAQVNDFRRVTLWSPWIESDPNARVVHAGPPRGVDAAMSWDGTIIGSGTQRITASEPYRYVEWAISPGEPGAARSWFEIDPVDGGTAVSWHFESDYGYNLVGRYFSLLLGGVVRRDYESGLVRLKALAESLPRIDFSGLAVESIVVEAMPIAYLRATSRPDPAAMSAALGDAYFEILNFIDKHGLQESGAPLSIMRAFSGGQMLFDAAIPVRGVTAATPADGSAVRLGQSYAGKVIRVKHIGPYRTLGRTHREIGAYLAALGLRKNGDAWESYVSDPASVAESELLTYVYYPVRP